MITWINGQEEKRAAPGGSNFSLAAILSCHFIKSRVERVEIPTVQMILHITQRLAKPLEVH